MPNSVLQYLFERMRQNRMNTKTRKIVITALMASLTCVATMVIKVPSPLNGYLNLGDCIVLLCGWLLTPWYAFFAAGFGSALADLFSGYAVYAPATFVIKGLMALAAFFCLSSVKKPAHRLLPRLAGGVLAEMIMVAGYFVFEGFLYGFGPSAVNIPANGVQGIAGLVIGLVLISVFEKTDIHF